MKAFYMPCRVMAAELPEGSFAWRVPNTFSPVKACPRDTDKVCDRISDEVVDLYYRTTIAQGLDVWSLRCAAETLATTNKVVIAGEFRGTDAVTEDLIAHHARMAIKDIGYDQAGFSWRDADVEVLPARPVRPRRPGRRRLRQQGRGRGRPGHHVRLCRRTRRLS